ncbi:MAG TPA: hypothetical protein VNZ64_12600 [Candidatus Acidoferrum sp.]|nr:hypothetical protein [Candidatus Acidoferrum sp.]
MKTSVSREYTLSALCLVLALPDLARADFVPIQLAPDSFNQDVIVERMAPPPLVPVTTASMDTGSDNTGFAWCERGYNLDWAAVGLPAADTTVTIGVAMDHDCRFAPTYKTNNVLLIDSVLTNGALTFGTPMACAQLSFLVSGGNGGGAVGYKVHHQDGATDAGTVTCPDWLDTWNAAYTTGGRVNVNTFSYADLNMNRPGLFLTDVELTNTTSPVTSVEFTYQGGSSHNAIFAVSGAAATGAPFVAMPVSGFNADVVVEASATRKGFLRGVTTATPESGAANWGNAWYEQGYYSPVPGSGLPAAGSIVTNAAAPDHRYLLPPDYTANNAIVLDADCPNATLTSMVPARAAALSFLGAAGNGPVTVGCQVHHADGNTETNWFLLQDWLSATPAALPVNGRVNLDFRTVDLVNGSGLFAKDIALTNTNSPVASLVLTYAGGAATSHAVLFAVSASTGAPAPSRPALAITPWLGGTVKIHSSAPGELQSTTSLSGPNTTWQSEGAILSEIVIQPAAAEPAKYYRLIAH